MSEETNEPPLVEELSFVDGDGPPKKRGLVRRMYDWVLHWAETPYGSPALAGLSAVESVVFPIPPDPLLIALCLGRAERALRFALIATIGSVVGGIIGYGLGAFAWGALSEWFFAVVPGVSQEAFDRIGGSYNQYGFWFVFLAGLTPIPYKVFTLSAGVFGINFPIFVIASALSRGLRFFILAGLIWKYGEPIGAFVDKYFNALMWAFGFLLVAGFVVIKMVL